MVISMEAVLNNNRSTKLYLFQQNNSGGKFHFTDDLSQRVYIEAYDANHANSLAENIGIYFDGCRKNIDCNCCGDRWDMAYDPYSMATIEEFEENIRIKMKYAHSETSVFAVVHTLNNCRYTIEKNKIIAYNKITKEQHTYNVNPEHAYSVIVSG